MTVNSTQVTHSTLGNKTTNNMNLYKVIRVDTNFKYLWLYILHLLGWGLQIPLVDVKAFCFPSPFESKSSGELINTRVDGCYLDTQILLFEYIQLFSYLYDFSLIWKYHFISHPILLLYLAVASFLAMPASWLGCSPYSTNSTNLGCFGVKKGKLK